MIYEAHPGESLIHHLRLTAELAERYGAQIGVGKLARQLGLLHDVGKHTEKFQKVLKHELGKIDHAIVAAEIYNDQKYGNGSCRYINDESIHIIMLRILAGHHFAFKGDYDTENDELYIEDNYFQLPADFTDRNITEDSGKENAVGSREEYEEIGKFVLENGLLISIDEKEYAGFRYMGNAAKMLFVRMLFSCLVDADYTASANTLKEISDFTENYEINHAEKMLDLLFNYRKSLCEVNNQSSGINLLRNKVYLDASEMGKVLPIGIYTMTAPTGTGKTLALIKFALEQAKRNGQKRVFVVLPFLSIISQNANTYKKIFGESVVLEDDSIVENDEKTKELAEKWDMPIIVTTSVRFFQTMFSSEPPSLRKLHQIANSVVVFDEAQTLSCELTSVTMRTLHALPQYFRTTVLLSTATQPAYNMRKDLTWKAEEIIKEPQKLYRDYGVLKNTDVIFDIVKDYSFDELAVCFCEYPQALYICNTTKKAKKLYDAVSEKHGTEEVFLLTSRLCTDHKKELIQEVCNRLGKGERCHLISTQGVEAGVDIDFPQGCREYSPFTSITQAAGRINRNGKRKGKMLVFRFGGDTMYDFPDQNYQNESNISYSMACRKNGLIDINDLENIEYYYQCLYGGYAGEDRESIQKCEAQEDIFAMSQEYHLIEDKGQYTVIVPYEEEDFNAWRAEIVKSGYRVQKRDLKKYQKNCVRLIGNGKTGEFIRSHCHQLLVRTKYGDAYIPWFIADKDVIYDGKTGLRTEEIAGGIFI